MLRPSTWRLGRVLPFYIFVFFHLLQVLRDLPEDTDERDAAAVAPLELDNEPSILMIAVNEHFHGAHDIGYEDISLDGVLLDVHLFDVRGKLRLQVLHNAVPKF